MPCHVCADFIEPFEAVAEYQMKWFQLGALLQHPTTQPRPAAVGAKRGWAAEGGQTGPDADRAAAVWTSFGPSPSGPRPGPRPAVVQR